MSINWFSLLLALMLLLPRLPFPPNFWRSQRHRTQARPGGVAGVWQNWVDLVRAALGVYVLSNWAVVINDSNAPGAELKALALRAGVLGLVILVQMIRVPRSVQFLAPLFYLSGLTLVLAGFGVSAEGLPRWFPQWLPGPGPFAVAVGWLFAICGKNLAYQLPAMAVAAAAAGYILGQLLPALLSCGLILVPLILSALFKKRLLFAAAPSAAV